MTFPLSVVGLVLWASAAFAKDFSAEADFLTRASNSNLFAVAELRLALDRTHDPKVKTFARQGENRSNALTLYADYMLWGDYEKLHALAIKMIPITEAQLKDAQALDRGD